MPYMIGFVVLGLSALNYAEEYCGNFSKTFAFVFWTQISDTMGDTADSVREVSFILGTIWFVIMAALGTMFVWTLITVIIEDSYMEAKYKKNNLDDLFGL